ncbi:YaaC family protein [Shouchella lonarensis]|uniref:YaaC-like Protein n=1 Tax=Shouchella lonarensis TaxID=1464122 RepID=A0A1G6LUD5_9BACI|nr:YaaC family protein [Shouchella lonarensis]SDC46809.1 YaaC-like Protein [Shouchella lonarensis]
MEHMTLFESAPYTRAYLAKRYESLSVIDVNKMSYKNCYTFMYQLKHGKLYLSQAHTAPIDIQPMLLFYGLTQLIKACILTVDPFYPTTTAVLAHGVTTRKRKKQDYAFLDDEVKIQHRGLYKHMLNTMFHMKHFPIDKYTMKILLKQLPAMQPLFQSLRSEDIYFIGKHLNESTIVFDSNVLDQYHMTATRMTNYLHDTGLKNDSLHTYEKRGDLFLTISTGNFSVEKLTSLRFTQTHTPVLHRNRADCLLLPELAVYYLVLYNLSMICRYETEWWGERLHTMDSDDIPFIKSFLRQAQERIPQLISAELDT